MMNVFFHRKKGFVVPKKWNLAQTQNYNRTALGRRGCNGLHIAALLLRHASNVASTAAALAIAFQSLHTTKVMLT